MENYSFKDLTQDELQIILKELWSAMRLELTGKEYYQAMMNQAADKETKEMLIWLADEEVKHLRILEELYKSLHRDKEWKSETLVSMLKSNQKVDNPVILEQYQNRIKPNSFVLAVLSNGILLENNAVNHYTRALSVAKLPAVKDFFQQMINWEKEHFSLLSNLESQLQEEYWVKQDFWPF